MATTTRAELSATPDLDEFTHHWQDEADAAYLYRVLAEAERDAHRRDVFTRLAAVEDRHVEIWRDLLTRAGAPPGVRRQPSDHGPGTSGHPTPRKDRQPPRWP